MHMYGLHHSRINKHPQENGVTPLSSKEGHSSFFGRTGAVYEGEERTSIELMRSFANLTPGDVPVLYPVNDSGSLL